MTCEVKITRVFVFKTNKYCIEMFCQCIYDICKRGWLFLFSNLPVLVREWKFCVIVTFFFECGRHQARRQTPWRISNYQIYFSNCQRNSTLCLIFLGFDCKNGHDWRGRFWFRHQWWRLCSRRYERVFVDVTSVKPVSPRNHESPGYKQ